MKKFVSIIQFSFIFSFLFFISAPAQAVIGPEPSAGTPTDYTAPAMLSDIALSSDGVKVVITWTDPPESDFYRVEILRNDGTGTMVTGDVRTTVAKDIRRYEDIEVLEGQNYLYRFRVSDLRLNTRLSDEYVVLVVAPSSAPAPSPLPAQTGQPSPTEGEGVQEEAVAPTSPLLAGEGSSGEVVEEISPLLAGEGQGEGIADPGNLDRVLSRFSLNRDAAAEAQYRAYIVRDMGEFEIQSTATAQNAIVNFVVYGASSATRRLGAGERRALVRDYFETVGRGIIDWSDIEKMATGVKPVGRNLERERSQLPAVLSAWVKMRGRNPNFQDASEDLAWNTMMYRVRFPRDLVKEAQGATKFRAIFKRTPTSPLDWSAVRALGYVL